LKSTTVFTVKRTGSDLAGNFKIPANAKNLLMLLVRVASVEKNKWEVLDT